MNPTILFSVACIDILLVKSLVLRRYGCSEWITMIRRYGCVCERGRVRAPLLFVYDVLNLEYKCVCGIDLDL